MGGLSAQMILHHHRSLHAALKMTVRWQVPARNPARRVRTSQGTGTGRRWIAETCYGIDRRGELHPLETPNCSGCVACGFRRGEILALQWESFDWRKYDYPKATCGPR